MKALVFNNVVMQVSDVEFEVHQDWKWVECTDDIKQGYSFDGQTFRSSELIPNRTYAELRAKKYPPIGDQLDALFKAGLFPEDMAIKIQAVKDQYPKD